jgi:IclR family transcriptional regulator, acetate operon repressor
MVPVDGNRRAGGAAGVQSIERAFTILEAMADDDGVVGVSDLVAQTHLPLATIHRLLRTLVDLGYVRQDRSRQYSLGPRLMRLADASARQFGVLARPYMLKVVETLGESANLAVLDGDEIVYIAQVQPSLNFMRMFTEVGRRAQAHSTGVGKAILATHSDPDVLALLARTGMHKLTERTIVDPEAFLADLRLTRDRGYAVDDGEQELGVRCVAVAIPEAPQTMGLSISGPLTRLTDGVVEIAALTLKSAAVQIGKEFGMRASQVDAAR